MKMIILVPVVYLGPTGGRPSSKKQIFDFRSRFPSFRRAVSSFSLTKGGRDEAFRHGLSLGASFLEFWCFFAIGGVNFLVIPRLSHPPSILLLSRSCVQVLLGQRKTRRGLPSRSEPGRVLSLSSGGFCNRRCLCFSISRRPSHPPSILLLSRSCVQVLLDQRKTRRGLPSRSVSFLDLWCVLQ